MIALFVASGSRSSPRSRSSFYYVLLDRFIFSVFRLFSVSEYSTFSLFLVLVMENKEILSRGLDMTGTVDAVSHIASANRLGTFPARTSTRRVTFRLIFTRKKQKICLCTTEAIVIPLQACIWVTISLADVETLEPAFPISRRVAQGTGYEVFVAALVGVS